MVEIRSQAELRLARKIGFCCLCGAQFEGVDEVTRQHIPPKTIFAESDRNPPLILPAHLKCNGDQSSLDTVIGQLVATLHGKYPEPADVKLEVDLLASTDGEHTVAGVKNLPLRTIVFRWVRCFHAALYGEYLIDKGGMIFEPFPAGHVIRDELVYEEIHMNRPYLVALFKQQVAARRTDGIMCYNDKCQYRCSWLAFDDGREFCLFALRLYKWEELGDKRHPRMGCVGWYMAKTPIKATRGTRVEVSISNVDQFDPFGR